jgi:hypothetical protein
MRKSQAKQTTAENLEQKFDRGEEVLDYFDLRKARVITPPSNQSVRNRKFANSVKSNSKGAAVVREKSARYRKKK